MISVINSLLVGQSRQYFTYELSKDAHIISFKICKKRRLSPGKAIAAHVYAQCQTIPIY